jgi:hypothetical protein
MLPTDTYLRQHTPGPENGFHHATEGGPERVYLKHGYGMVGQGKSPEEAQKDLWEQLRQAREA